MIPKLLDIPNIVVAEVGYFLLFFVPVGALLFSLYWSRKRDRRETVAPFSELRRRPAGESVRLRVEEVNEQIDPWIFTLTTIPIIGALGVTIRQQSLTVVIFVFLAVAMLCLLAGMKLRPLLRERAAYRLGFHGERYVAEELNQLMADGFHVFHDVPFGKYNMDHVLVGPTGVFVVETKTKRKRRADGKTKYKVIFDGIKLIFPNCNWNTDWLEQTRLHAKSLTQWLRSATAKQITVQPILTIPGWLVKRTDRADLHLLNPKEIRQVILEPQKHSLDPAQSQRACHQLEEKCKLPIE